MSPARTPPLLAALLLCMPACSRPDDGAAATATDDGTASTSAADSSGAAATDSSGADATAATAGAPTTGDVAEAEGCAGAPLLAVPEDSSLAGPWPVGARTVQVGARTAEVWYPAEPGSDAGAQPLRYDIRASLPDSEQDKVPDASNPWQDCGCYRDLPIDAAHGPYPAVVFVHGTAGFRSQSLELVTHWASRGFVVIAADHPGLWLKDLLGSLCGLKSPAQDLAGDIAALVAAVQEPAGDLAFLQGRVDGERIGMAGHSAGGYAIEGQGGVAQVLIPMAAGGTTAGAALKSTLVLGAQADKVVGYKDQQDGYASSPPRKRLVGIANAGHLAFSSLCSLRNADGQDFLQIAAEFEVCGAQFAGALFDCQPTYTPDAIGWAIANYASAAALEETLHCSASADLAGLPAKFAEVGEFAEAL